MHPQRGLIGRLGVPQRRWRQLRGGHDLCGRFHGSANEAADLDADGNLDLVVANILDDDISILFGNGDGTFQPQVRYPVPANPRGVALLDVEGDGDMDVAVACRNGSNVRLYLNAGDGTMLSSGDFDAGVSGETGVAACDMNGDLITDLVVIGNQSANVAVLLGDGAGNFALESTTMVGFGPWMVVVGDVDGDGDCDAAVALASGGAVAIAKNDGSGSFTEVASYPTGSFTIAVDLGPEPRSPRSPPGRGADCTPPGFVPLPPARRPAARGPPRGGAHS